MRRTITSFIKTSGIFFVGSVLSKIIVILLLPLYTNYISKENYGYFDLSVTYISVVTSILYFDIWATSLRFLYDARSDLDKKKVLQHSWLMFTISSVIFVILVITIGISKTIPYWRLILLYGLSVNMHNMAGFISRGLRKNTAFAISGIINTFVIMAANIILILGFKIQIQALYISAIAGNLIQVVFLTVKANIFPRILSTFVFDSSLMRNILRYTLPLSINSVSYWILTGYNRIIIEQVLGVSANGLYAVGNKFGASLSLITTSFTYAWQDTAFMKEQEDGNKSAFYSRACEIYFISLSVGIAFLLPLFRIAFPILIGDQYQAVFKTIPLFLIMALIISFSTFIGNIFYAIKDTRSLFLTMATSSVCNLVISRPLISLLEINGANLAISISFIVNILFRFMILRKKIQLKPRPLIYAGGVGILSVGTVFFLRASIWGNIVLIGIFLCLGVIYFLHIRRKVRID